MFDARSRFIGVRCSMFDVQCSMFKVRCWMFDVGCSMPARDLSELVVECFRFPKWDSASSLSPFKVGCSMFNAFTFWGRWRHAGPLQRIQRTADALSTLAQYMRVNQKTKTKTGQKRVSSYEQLLFAFPFRDRRVGGQNYTIIRTDPFLPPMMP